MFKFKVGDRVRYIAGSREYLREVVGKVGVITECKLTSWSDWPLRYVVVGECNLSNCKQENLELVGPVSPFEENLMAYIAAEKKELGLA